MRSVQVGLGVAAGVRLPKLILQLGQLRDRGRRSRRVGADRRRSEPDGQNGCKSFHGPDHRIR